MEYQGNEIYWEGDTCLAAPINADGTLDKSAVCEATETPEVVRALASIETELHDGWPLYILADGEEGAYVLSLFEYDSELPIAEGFGATFLEAAEALRTQIIDTTILL